MFYLLLLATLAVAVLVSWLTARFFDAAIARILRRIVGDALAEPWQRYLRFAMLVVGVSGGVRLWSLEKYLEDKPGTPALDGARWTLEIYRTLIDTLQSIAWLLLLFCLCTMIAYVIVRAVEARTGHRLDHDDEEKEESRP